MRLQKGQIILWCFLLCLPIVSSFGQDNQQTDAATPTETDIPTETAPETEADTPAEVAAETVTEVTEEVTENVGEAVTSFTELVSLPRVLSVICLFICAWLTVRFLNFLFNYFAQRSHRYRLRILRLQPFVIIAMWAITFYIIVMTIFKPQAETLYAMLASSALALGFAAQDILKNIFGGLMIILDRPFQIGDRIQIAGNYGEVVGIGLRTTRINTLDDNVITVPNSMIISDAVSNANDGALDCMVVINLWLPINLDVSKVRKIAYEAAITSKYLNMDKAVNILFFEHFDAKPATNIKIKAYVLDARYEKAFESDVTEAAKKALRESKVYQKNEST